MYLREHLEKLQYFYEVANEGSIKAAAKKLHLTQPSITKSIKILEEAVGKKLFQRHARGMLLTKEGELLLRYCYEFFSHLTDLEFKFESPEDPMAGSIKVGTYDSIAIYFWPKFLRSFLLKYPQLNLQLTTGRSHEIQHKVENGELDLGLIIEPEETVQSNIHNLGTDYFRLYRATKVKPIYADINTAPLIYMPDALAGGDNLRLSKKMADYQDGSQRKLYKTSSMESAKELALNGIGIALLPKMVAQSEVKRKSLSTVELKGFPEKGIGKHRIGIVYSKYRGESEVIKRLIAELKAQKW